LNKGAVMRSAILTKPVTLAVAWLAVLALARTDAAPAQHACDAIGEEGWKIVATTEIVDVRSSAPYRVGADWVVDRTTTFLPLCNYFNHAGNYSLRSYALDPMDEKERVVLCHGAATPVPPYAGPCPPP
jgi:hypothetical protein